MGKHQRARYNTGTDWETTLVTGAAKRIGAHIVTALHVAGMNVVLHYRNS
ncbi:MAG TPA: hypothetical protein VHJ19_08675 [Gammaproteobacteria bacterium]|nr:hypothetical protein [Gammaproteobacteria bacterium]